MPFSAKPLSEVPAGNVPPASEYVYGATPPLCPPNGPHASAHPSSTLQYLAQAGIKLAESRSAMSIAPATWAVLPAASATTIVNLYAPPPVGVPEMVPSPPRTRPEGNAPVPTVHV